MGGNLIEVVFANVGPVGTQALFEAVGSCCSSLKIDRIDGEDAAEDRLDLALIEFEAWIQGRRLDLGAVGVPQFDMRILKDGDCYDVSLQFVLEEMEGAGDVAGMIQPWAARIARASGVVEYFCGLEPAEDEETRLFTGSSLGPLHLSLD